MLSIPSWLSSLLLGQIYQSAVLLWAYGVFKGFYRFVSGTSELYRVCDAAVTKIDSAPPPTVTITELPDVQKSDEVEKVLVGGGALEVNPSASGLVQRGKTVGGSPALGIESGLSSDFLTGDEERVSQDGDSFVMENTGGQTQDESTQSTLEKTDDSTPLVPTATQSRDRPHIPNLASSGVLGPSGFPDLSHRIDQILLHSKTLKVERRDVESKEWEANEVLVSILQKKRFPNGDLSTPQALVLKQCLFTIHATYRLMHILNERAATKYDVTNPAHERKLLELWNLLMPNQTLENRISKQWQEIGFQGTDPATDFRGMGLLGLDDLYFFAKYYPEESAGVLKTSHNEMSWFSMAIVGINITAYLLQLLRTRQLQHFFFTYGPTREAYHHFYCYMFCEFEEEWKSTASPLSLMDFNRVFAAMKHRIEKVILERKVLLRGLRRMKGGGS